MPSPRDDEFLRHLSHELRNPLSPLRHGLQLLQRFRFGDQSITPILEIMERQVAKLSQLVDELDAHRLGRPVNGTHSDLPKAAMPAAAPDNGGSGSKKQIPWERVMVVDDNIDAAQGLAALLQSMGPTVEIAADGRQALQLASRFHPQLVFMDIVMPQLDGLQTARALRAEPWAGDLIICALTGSGDPHDQASSSLAGIDYHLVKPVDPRALVAIMSD